MNKKNIYIYTFITNIWSYTLWIIAILLAFKNNTIVILNENVPEALYNGEFIGKAAIIGLLALLATWGPLVGSTVISIIDNEFKKEFKSRLQFISSPKYYLIVIGIYLLIGFLPSIPLFFVNETNDISVSTGLLYFVTFFLIQLVSSGFEEFGWRGFLLPEFLKKYGSWDACFYTGIFWALWHTPIVLYIFYLQGMPIIGMITSFIGFSIGIVAMSVIHFYFYQKTKSVLFSVFVHTIGNSIPLIVALLIANSNQVAIVSQLLLWVVVAIIMKKNQDLFPMEVKKPN